MWTWYALANNWFIAPMLLATGTALGIFVQEEARPAAHIERVKARPS